MKYIVTVAVALLLSTSIAESVPTPTHFHGSKIMRVCGTTKTFRTKVALAARSDAKAAVYIGGRVTYAVNEDNRTISFFGEGIYVRLVQARQTAPLTFKAVSTVGCRNVRLVYVW